MILHRRSTSVFSDHEQKSVEWKCYGEEAHMDFREFGAGSERFSWFEVRLGWEDIETIIEVMADKGHGEANRVRAALKLAEAVKAVANNEASSLSGD
jgi:hypothetical protein